MRTTTYLIPLVLLVACTVPTAYMVEKTALQTPCSEDEISIVGGNPKAGRGDFDWDARCQDRTYHCRHRIKGENIAFICQDASGEPASVVAAAPTDAADAANAAEAGASAVTTAPEPAGTAEPSGEAGATPQAAVAQPQPAGSSHLTREEIMAVLTPLVPQLRECVGAEAGAQPLSLTLEIYADGTASFQSSMPQPSPQAAECLGRMVGTLQFRATTDDSMYFTTPPIQLNE